MFQSIYSMNQGSTEDSCGNRCWGRSFFACRPFWSMLFWRLWTSRADAVYATPLTLRIIQRCCPKCQPGNINALKCQSNQSCETMQGSKLPNNSEVTKGARILFSRASEKLSQSCNKLSSLIHCHLLDNAYPLHKRGAT